MAHLSKVVGKLTDDMHKMQSEASLRISNLQSQMHQQQHYQ